MGHAAVLVRGPASVTRDVRRDRPEHSLPLETERATSSAAWVHDESCKKKMSHITIVTCVLFSCAVVFVLCVFVVCLAKDSLVTKKEFFSWFLGRW